MEKRQVIWLLKQYRTSAKEIKALKQIQPPEYQQRIEEWEVFQAEIKRALFTLDHLQRTAVQRKYIDGAKWLQIARECHYSESRMHQLNSCALKVLGTELESSAIVRSFLDKYTY